MCTYHQTVNVSKLNAKGKPPVERVLWWTLYFKFWKLLKSKRWHFCFSFIKKKPYLITKRIQQKMNCIHLCNTYLVHGIIRLIFYIILHTVCFLFAFDVCVNWFKLSRVIYYFFISQKIYPILFYMSKYLI